MGGRENLEGSLLQKNTGGDMASLILRNDKNAAKLRCSPPDWGTKGRAVVCVSSEEALSLPNKIILFELFGDTY